MRWEVLLFHILLRKPDKIKAFIQAAVALVRDQIAREEIAIFRKTLDEKAIQIENGLWPAGSNWRSVLESNKCTVEIQRKEVSRNKKFEYTEPEKGCSSSKLSKIQTNHFEILAQLYKVEYGKKGAKWIEGRVTLTYDINSTTYSSAFELLRLIRNKLEHDTVMPVQFKEALGWYSEAGILSLSRFLAYWNTHFPDLFSFCFKEFYELNSQFSDVLSDFFPKSDHESDLKLQIAQLPTQVDKLAKLLVDSVNNFENEGNLTGPYSSAVLPVDLIQRLLDGSTTLVIHISHENLKCEWYGLASVEAEASWSLNSASESEPLTILIAIRTSDNAKHIAKRNVSNRYLQITASSEINLLQLAPVKLRSLQKMKIEFAQKLISKYLDTEAKTGIGPEEEKALIDKVSALVTPDIISDDEFHLVKDTIPPLPSGTYIPRHLYKRVVINSLLFKEKCTDIFVFKNVGRYQLTELLGMQQTASSSSQIDDGISNRFIRLDLDVDWEQIRKQAKTPAHLISFNSQDQEFLLEDTTRDSNILHKYINRPLEFFDKAGQNSISEEEFISEMLAMEDNAHKSYIISDSPGMGKTYLLSNLARKMAERSPNRVMVQFIQLNSLFEKLKSERQCSDETESVNVILEHICTSQVAQSVFMALLTAGVVRLELFLDSLDEVSYTHGEFAMKLVQDIGSKMLNSRTFISSRTQLRTELEVSLGVISYNILPLTQANRINFLVNFWTDLKIKDDDDVARLPEFAKICLEQFEEETTKDERELAGIPLQCRILAAVTANRAKRYCSCKGDNITLKDLVRNLGNSIPHLYKEYVDLCWLKCSELPNVREVKNFHIWHALTLFAPEVAAEYATTFKVNTGSETSAPIFSAGLLEKYLTGHGERITFVHRTFGEYVTAEFFSSLVKEDNQLNGSDTEAFRANVLATFIKRFLMNNISWKETRARSNRSMIMFDHSVIANFINFTLAETNWKNERLCILSGVLLNCTTPENFFNLLLSCLRHNYSNIFGLVTEAISRVESSQRQKFLLSLPKDEVVSVLITAASKHSSVPLIEKLSAFLLDNLSFDMCTAFKNVPDTYFNKVVRTFKTISFPSTEVVISSEKSSPLIIAVVKMDYDMVQFLATKMPLEGQDLISRCVRFSIWDNVSLLKKRLDICELLFRVNSKLLEELHDCIPEKVHLSLVKWILATGGDILRTGYGEPSDLLPTFLCNSTSKEEREEICSTAIDNCRRTCGFSSTTKLWYEILCDLLFSQVSLTLPTISSILNVFSNRHRGFLLRLKKLYFITDATLQPDCIKNIVMKHIFRELLRRKQIRTIVRYKKTVSRRNPICFLEGKPYLDVFPTSKYLGLHLDFNKNTWLHCYSSSCMDSTFYHDAVTQIFEKLKKIYKYGEEHLFSIKNNDGQLPIHLAVERIEVKKDTLKIFQTCGVNMNARDINGFSILCYALKGKRSVNFLQNLIEIGADVYSKDYFGNTFLHNLAMNNYSPEDFNQMTQYLIDNGHGKLLEIANYYDQLPLHCAISEPNEEPFEKTINFLCWIIRQKKLFKRRAKFQKGISKKIVNTETNAGKSPIHLAVDIGISGTSVRSLNLVKQLISLKANVDANNWMNVSVAHWAAAYGRRDLLKYVVNKGCNINNKDILHNNVLQCIFYNTNLWSEEQILEFVTLLVSKGADKGNKNSEGKTAYELAKEKKISDKRILDALQPDT